MPFNASGTRFDDWEWDSLGRKDKGGKEEQMVAYHLAASQFQLSQLYYGMSMALALNRTLILPKVGAPALPPSDGDSHWRRGFAHM